MTIDDELALTTGLDQPLKLNETTKNKVLGLVDDVISEAKATKDAKLALEKCKELIEISKLAGLALAKLIYKIREVWDELNTSPDRNFEDEAYIYLGLHERTVNRYLRVWELFEDNLVPEKLKDELMQQNIKSLIPIATAIKQGYEISNTQWEELADASDYNEVAQIIREDVKGKERRVDALIITIDNIGSLFAEQAGTKYFIGSLEVSAEEEPIQHAIRRIIENIGIMRR